MTCVINILSSLLVELLTKRFKEIFAKSTNCESSQQFQEKLDCLERTLYAAGQKSLRSTDEWLARRTDRIRAGRAVANHLRKRKAKVAFS